MLGTQFQLVMDAATPEGRWLWCTIKRAAELQDSINYASPAHDADYKPDDHWLPWILPTGISATVEPILQGASYTHLDGDAGDMWEKDVLRDWTMKKWRKVYCDDVVWAKCETETTAQKALWEKYILAPRVLKKTMKVVTNEVGDQGGG